MIKNSDRHKAFVRKRLWDLFGWGYGEGYLGFLRNNHSLNCGSCTMCRDKPMYKKLTHKRNRQKIKRELLLVEN